MKTYLIIPVMCTTLAAEKLKPEKNIDGLMIILQ